MYNGSIHLNRPLTNYARGVVVNEHCAEFCLPALRVDSDHDSYFVNLGNEAIVTEMMAGPTAEGAPYPYDDGEVDTKDYSIGYRGVARNLPMRTVNRADAPLDLEMATAWQHAWKLRTLKEVDAANKLFTAANWPTGHKGNPAAKWDATGATVKAIKNDIGGGAYAIFKATGRWPNAILVGTQAYAEGIVPLFEPTRDVDRDVMIDELTNIFWWCKYAKLAESTKAADVDSTPSPVWNPANVMTFVMDENQMNNPDVNTGGNNALGRTIKRRGGQDINVYYDSKFNPPGGEMLTELGWTYEIDYTYGYLHTATVS